MRYKKNKILFSCVGRRVELMQAFRDASKLSNIPLTIYGTDADMTAPSLFFCDKTFKLVNVKDNNYIDELLNICKREDIDLIIPTIDTDLLKLSENKYLFEKAGTKVLISEVDKIRICRDKNNTSSFFYKIGLNAPKTYNDISKYDGSFPCFIKPKDGSSSINAYKVKNMDELIMYSKIINDYIIQEYIDGVEYTVDCFSDFNSNILSVVPRVRVSVRSGEVLKTKIDLDNKIIEDSKKILNYFNAVGPITIQLIRDKLTNKDYYIEINPRFGGGAPLSIKAGANTPLMILKLLNGDKIDNEDLSAMNNNFYSRFDNSICINQNESKNTKIRGVIFDLDDTLYSEKEYVKSGFNKISKYLSSNKIINKSKSEIYNELLDFFNNKNQAIDLLLNKYNKNNYKTVCLDMYREHIPNIHLYDGVLELIKELKSNKIKLGIITDGRINGQKNKIKALQLDKYIDDIIITDELGGIQFRKPNDISFRIMQNRWNIPFSQIVYIGDNLSKDFIAPKQLGMNYIYFENVDGLYY